MDLNIGSNVLKSNDGSVGLSSSLESGDYSFWAGAEHGYPSTALFSVKNDGSIMALSGKIGGFDIETSVLKSINGSVGLSSSLLTDAYSFWAGAINDDPSTALFSVKNDGSINALSGIIGGLILSDGKLSSSNFEIKTTEDQTDTNTSMVFKDEWKRRNKK